MKMTVKELIKQLMDCDMNDEVYVAVNDESSDTYPPIIHYSIDGLENNLYEYRNKPTIATLKVEKP